MTAQHTLLRGLYVITDASLTPGPRLATAVAAALRGGARLVQYRDKTADESRRHTEASTLRSLCRAHGVPFIVNDDVELAAAVGADGVHLGRDDASLPAARARLGPDAIIGASCYDSLARALDAEANGADYVAFGSFFPSPTKPHAIPAPLALLGEARRRLHIPICAIGGIRTDNAAVLLTAGADMLAVVSGVFGADDVEAAAREFAHLFTT
ncbi:MAG TPA: thiamine phosphate synthase [Gammaproteobacteria bacterium]|nr:thiamine phosphate synthase [Gammaproteobacteria bacterium]